jgi:RNA polymerase sigma factor (sigma-70 family)
MTIDDKIAISRTVARRLVRYARDFEVDDLVQDGMVQILKSASWDGRGEEGAYYAVLARWGCLNRLAMKDRAHHRHGRSVGIDHVPGDLVTSPPLQHRQFESRARVVRLRRAITGLPTRWRTVVRRHCIEGAAIGDVARELGVSTRAAAQLLFVARRRLRTQVFQDV